MSSTRESAGEHRAVTRWSGAGVARAGGHRRPERAPRARPSGEVVRCRGLDSSLDFALIGGRVHPVSIFVFELRMQLFWRLARSAGAEENNWAKKV